MAVATRKKDNKVIFWASFIAVGLWFITSYEWGKLAVYLPVAFFVFAFFLFFLIPTRCRYPNRNPPDGLCRNKAWGILFGCTQYHFLLKARAKLGIGEQEAPPPVRSRKQGTGGTSES